MQEGGLVQPEGRHRGALGKEERAAVGEVKILRTAVERSDTVAEKYKQKQKKWRRGEGAKYTIIIDKQRAWWSGTRLSRKQQVTTLEWRGALKGGRGPPTKKSRRGARAREL